MKSYTIESQDCSPQLVKSNGTVVIREFDRPEWFVKLTENAKGDSYTYEWNHGAGSGSFTIPADVLYDLPELLIILNDAGDRRIFSSTRIYCNKPIAKLFGSED